MKLSLALAALLLAAPALAQTSGTANAVYDTKVALKGGSVLITERKDSSSRAVYWVTPEGCAWDHTDQTKPARLLGCAAKPDVMKKIAEEATFNYAKLGGEGAPLAPAKKFTYKTLTPVFIVDDGLTADPLVPIPRPVKETR